MTSAWRVSMHNVKTCTIYLRVKSRPRKQPIPCFALCIPNSVRALLYIYIYAAFITRRFSISHFLESKNFLNTQPGTATSPHQRACLFAHICARYSDVKKVEGFIWLADGFLRGSDRRAAADGLPTT